MRLMQLSLCINLSLPFILSTCSREAWKETPFWQCFKSHRRASFIECVLYVLKCFNQDDFELFVTLCLAIWSEICKRKHASSGKRNSIGVTWVYAMFDSV